MPGANQHHRDFLKRNLDVGDIVTSTSQHYADQVLFRVVSFTPKKIRVGLLIKDKQNPGSYIDEFTLKGYTTLKEGYQVCLIQKFDNSSFLTPAIRFQ